LLALLKKIPTPEGAGNTGNTAQVEVATAKINFFAGTERVLVSTLTGITYSETILHRAGQFHKFNKNHIDSVYP